MKKFLQLIFVMLLCGGAIKGHAQFAEVVAAGGGFLSVAAGSLSVTIGQPIAGDVVQGVRLHQGFQVPVVTAAGLITAVEDVIDIQIYPNPFASTLFVETDAFSNGTIQLIDLVGRQVLPQAKLNQSKAELDVSALTQGVYLLRLFSPQGEVRTFSVVKSK